MTEFAVNSCPIRPDPPPPFTTGAAVTGRYRCAPGCSGEVSAVSEPVVTHRVDVALEQAVRPACARCGQTVRYTVTLHNRSTVPISRVRLTAPDLAGLLDVGNLCCDGQPVRGGNLDEGVLIPGVGAGCRTALTFDAAVPDGVSGLVAATAYAEFEFTAAGGAQRAAAASNEAALRVISPRLEIRKSADRCAVTPQEPSVTYTLTVRNTGTCPLSGVVVTDVLSPGLVYVPGSTAVNDGPSLNLDPAAGIPLGELEADGVAVITFRAAAEF